MPTKPVPVQRFLSIQEHDAKIAGLHWDLRICNGDRSGNCMISWVIPKHKLPDIDETLLAIPVEDHPWDYRDFEGVLSSGYGAGTVKLIHAGETKVHYMTDTKAKFDYDGKTYMLFGNEKRWFIKQVEKPIRWVIKKKKK